MSDREAWVRVWARIDAFLHDRRDGRAKGTVADAVASICGEELTGERDA